MGRPNCDGTWVADEVMGPRERPKEGTTPAVKRPASVAGSHPLPRLFGAGLPPRARNQATPTSLDLKGLCPTGALSDRHCRLRRRSVLATRLAAVLASSGSDHALAGLAPDHALAGLVPDHGPGWLVPDRRPGWLAGSRPLSQVYRFYLSLSLIPTAISWWARQGSNLRPRDYELTPVCAGASRSVCWRPRQAM